MSELKQGQFEGWAIVEMMGHQREIGFVTTEAYGQAVLFRVDTPELPEREFTLTYPEYAKVDGESRWCPAGSKVKRSASPPRSRLVAPGSLYALNPCTEEAARTALESTTSRPLILIEAPTTLQIALPRNDPDDDYDPYEDEDEREEVGSGEETEEVSSPELTASHAQETEIIPE